MCLSCFSFRSCLPKGAIKRFRFSQGWTKTYAPSYISTLISLFPATKVSNCLIDVIIFPSLTKLCWLIVVNDLEVRLFIVILLFPLCATNLLTLFAYEGSMHFLTSF